MTIETESAGYAQAVARVREIIAPLQPAAPATPVAGDFAGRLSSAMKPSPGGSAPTTAGGYISQTLGTGAIAPTTAGGRGRALAYARISGRALNGPPHGCKTL